jgi:mannose-6-phosphate isomerase-like protein (cupin superfamily)
MKRHRALTGLSHDHHHALVRARRLRRAAAASDDPAAAVEAFVAFFLADTVAHFREEEESIFPLVAGSDEARSLLVEALLDHQRLRLLVRELEQAPEPRGLMREIGELLEAHVRREERDLFPLIERLAAAELDRRSEERRPRGGPTWGTASEDLNATLLEWGPGRGPPEGVNEERDVLVFVVEGSALVAVGDERHELRRGDALIVGKGERRSITSGEGGVRYLSVHLRRPPLQIQSISGAAAARGGPGGPSPRPL